MKLENLEYFIVAAEELNFTRAAARLFITQQALSMHIAKLEKHYGCYLFDRNTPMSLTPEGNALLRNATRFLTIARETDSEIQDIKDFKNGELAIGITRSRGEFYLTPVLMKLHRKFPYIKIKLFEGSVAEVEEALQCAKIDVCIGFHPEIDYDVFSVPFWEELTIAVVPKDIIKGYCTDSAAILSGEQKADLGTFKNCPFIALNPKFHSAIPFYSACEEYRIKPNIVLVAQTLNSLVSFCISGMGILVCPDIFLYPYREMLQGENAKALIFTVGNSSNRQVCVNYLKNKYLSTVAKEFISILKETNYRIYL